MYLKQCKSAMKPHKLKTIVYKEIFAPILFSPLYPNPHLGQFKTGQIQSIQYNFFKKNYDWANLKWGRIILKCERAKITWGKKKPVYSQRHFTFF